MTGNIDEVGVWNRTLTDSEINDLWNKIKENSEIGHRQTMLNKTVSMVQPCPTALEMWHSWSVL